MADGVTFEKSLCFNDLTVVYGIFFLGVITSWTWHYNRLHWKSLKWNGEQMDDVIHPMVIWSCQTVSTPLRLCRKLVFFGLDPSWSNHPLRQAFIKAERLLQHVHEVDSRIFNEWPDFFCKEIWNLMWKLCNLWHFVVGKRIRCGFLKFKPHSRWTTQRFTQTLKVGNWRWEIQRLRWRP